MTSRLQIIGQAKATQVGRNPEVTSKGDEPGAEFEVYDCLVIYRSLLQIRKPNVFHSFVLLCSQHRCDYRCMYLRARYVAFAVCVTYREGSITGEHAFSFSS